MEGIAPGTVGQHGQRGDAWETQQEQAGEGGPGEVPLLQGQPAGLWAGVGASPGPRLETWIAEVVRRRAQAKELLQDHSPQKARVPQPSGIPNGPASLHQVSGGQRL